MVEDIKNAAVATPASAGESPRSEKESKNLQFFLIGLAGLVGVVVILFAGYGIFRVYIQGASDTGTYISAEVLRLPLAKVNGKIILYTDYLDDLKAIHTLHDFDLKSGGPSGSLTEQNMSDQVVLRFANNIFVDDLARNMGVTVEQKDVDDLKNQMLSQFKSPAEAETELMNRYGWTMAIYEQKVIRPYVLQKKISDKLSTDKTLIDAVRARAQAVLDQIKNGANFEEMAKKYGEDGTAAQGGDLGWFGKGDMVPQFETAAFALKKGELSQELVESPFGFHIIRVDDTKTEKVKDSTGKMVSKEMISARHIVFMFPSLEKSLDTALRTAQVSWYATKINNPLTVKK